MRTCELCTSEDDVKPIKIGMLICRGCREPMRVCHESMGGKVLKVAKKNVDPSKNM